MPFLVTGITVRIVCSAQVACGPCNAYSGHLYERLGDELGAADGMSMKSSFCEELVTACDGVIDFPTYDGLSYCEKHVGDDGDLLWSYPIDESGACHRLYPVRFRPTRIGRHPDVYIVSRLFIRNLVFSFGSYPILCFLSRIRLPYSGETAQNRGHPTDSGPTRPDSEDHQQLEKVPNFTSVLLHVFTV